MVNKEFQKLTMTEDAEYTKSCLIQLKELKIIIQVYELVAIQKQ